MIRQAGILLFVFLCFASRAKAQVQKGDSTIKDYTSYDTTLPKNDFIDTVHHIKLTRADSVSAERKEISKEDIVRASNDRRWIKAQIQNLAFYKMYGRGYVKGGRDSAAKYILKKFKEFKLKPVTKDGPWAQGFSFPVNTFPGKMELEINGDDLTAGGDYLIDPASTSFSAEDLKVKTINLDYVADTAAWRKILSQMKPDRAYYFENLDSFCNNKLQIRTSQFPALLPRGCYIIPHTGKLMWSVSRDTMQATVFYVDERALPKHLNKVTVDVNSLFIPHARSENIIAGVPGEVKDSFIVFSAHYDHLGMMGDTTYFPGASDNASGIAMLLYLAFYYAKHPQHYSIIFIAFAGEEAALMGSEFFVNYPFVPLKNIRFLINMDIMGDATNGVTVVNATEFPKEFDLLNKINDKNRYLPEIRSRGKAANSDHYYFTEAGVPSFFMYSNGGHGYYHDVFDQSMEVTLNNVDDVAKMLMDFVKELR